MGYDSDDTHCGPDSCADEEDSNDELELSAGDIEDSDDDDCSDDDSIKIVRVTPSQKKRLAMPKQVALRKKLVVSTHDATWTRKARVYKLTSLPTKKRSVTNVSELVLIQAPPPPRKPRDTLLQSCFTTKAVSHGKEKHTYATLVTSL